jgi:hypothetical protein
VGGSGIGGRAAERNEGRGALCCSATNRVLVVATGARLRTR